MNHVKNKDATANIRVDDFLAAHGGAFYTLQRQPGLLREDAFRAGFRALLPVSAAALLPLLAAGATQLPFKELLKVVKRLLLF